MLYRIVAIVCVVFVVSACGATKKPKPKINIELKNRPILPSSQTREAMAKKAEVINFGEQNLESLKQKFQNKSDLKIEIFGDSHIAGDFIPQEFRSLFMQENAIGFAYPIAPAYHQNLLVHYKQQLFEIYNSRLNTAYTDYPMGGVVARAKSEKAWLSLSLNLPQNNQKFSVRIAFKSPSLLGAFLIKDAKGRTYRLGAKVANQWELSSPLTLYFPITIQALLPNASLGGYFISNEATNNIITHLGINGARSDIWLKWNQAFLKQELGIIDYDLIMLCYGSNDAMLNPFDKKTYIQNYKNLIALLRQKNPNATILLMGPPKVVNKPKNAKSYKVTPAFEEVKKATQEIAKSEKTLYFDMYDFIEKTGGKNEWVKLALSKQDVHLTPYGYRLIADAIGIGLMRVFDSLPTTKPNTLDTTSKASTSHTTPATPKPQDDTLDSSKDSNASESKPTQSQDSKDSMLESKPQANEQTLLDTMDSNAQTLTLPPQESAPQEVWQDLQMKNLDDTP